MSQRLFEGDVIFLQRLMKSAGFYGGSVDGIWGTKTNAAVATFEAESMTIAATIGTFDLRSERRIQTLHPKAQEAARACLKAVRAQGIDARIIGGTRTYAEQNALCRIGRRGKKRRIEGHQRQRRREQPQFRARLGHRNFQ